MDQSTAMLTLDQIAEKTGGRVAGDGSIEIRSVNSLAEAQPGQITFLTSDRHAGLLSESNASAVIVAAPLEDVGIAQLVVDDPQAALIQVLGLFAPCFHKPAAGFHPTAVVHPTATIHPTASIGPHCTIGPNVAIGEETVLESGCHVGENSSIGRETCLHANVVVYPNCRIGNDCILHANTTIGATGFGYYPVKGRPTLIPHNGGVIIEDDVEIGANTCVDRAKFGNTVIGAGTKIDNQVQIAHNVTIGRCCLIAGQTGLAGSVRLGDGAIMAGDSGASDHITIGAGAIVGACSKVFSDVEPGKTVFGVPATDIGIARRSNVLIKRLPELAARLKALEKQVDQRLSEKDNR
ncbi:MAG: UDP-3-O-(3-hydroxymyristoyl)glucosamine N-acyltransferase [Sedimentisphaerales bacterium]|nr:UDP-3-O-(3-hydroxymyristoyl)glucosamine N-acyltransferase [Sedimentisphaerales bacterium]